MGVETAEAVRDFLADGIIRNAVNFPSMPAEEFVRLQPYVTLAERLGSLVSQMGDAHIGSVGVRYYGELANGRNDLIAGAVLVGLFKRYLSSGVTLVNAKAVAAERGIELVESHSSRARNYTSLLSVQVHTDAGQRWVEGTVVEHGGPRLVLVDGVPVDAPLEGTQILIKNDDRPGVIGAVGTVLGRHGINIANFALGRSAEGAIGVVGVDDVGGAALTGEVLAELRKIPAVQSAEVDAAVTAALATAESAGASGVASWNVSSVSEIAKLHDIAADPQHLEAERELFALPYQVQLAGRGDHSRPDGRRARPLRLPRPSNCIGGRSGASGPAVGAFGPARAPRGCCASDGRWRTDRSAPNRKGLRPEAAGDGITPSPVRSRLDSDLEARFDCRGDARAACRLPSDVRPD